MMDPDRNPWLTARWLIALCLFTLAAGGAFAFTGLKPERSKVPAKFTAFVVDDKTFACDAPDGWNKRSGSAQAIRTFAVFTSGQAKIDIDANLEGSLMADILRASQQMGDGGGMGMDEFGGGGGGGGVPGAGALGDAGRMPANTRKPPVQILHDVGAAKMAAEHPGYEESQAQAFQSALGEARLSDFTYKGDFFSKTMKGRRITILAGDKLVTVICESPQRDYVSLKPAFDRVVASLKPGGA